MGKNNKKESKAEAKEAESQTEASVPPLNEILYCDVCGFPPEYCEFSSSSTKCKAWLEKAHPALWSKYYSQDALDSKMGALTVEAQAKLEADTAKKEAKAEAKAELAQKKKQASKVIIRRQLRNKRKFITALIGLDTFDTELDKAAKLLAKRFACGASVIKNPQGSNDIEIQGDISDDLEQLLIKGYGIIKPVPRRSIEKIDATAKPDEE